MVKSKSVSVLNFFETHTTQNMCGFNIQNMQIPLLKDFFFEVQKDYDQSFIGSFLKALLSKVTKNHDVGFSATVYE